VAVDAHTNHQPGVFRVPEIHTSERVFMGQSHIGVRVKRDLSTGSSAIFRAMARRAVGTQQGVEGDFARFQRPSFVKTHLLGIGNGLDVSSTTSVGKLGKPGISEGPGRGNNQQNTSRESRKRNQGISFGHNLLVPVRRSWFVNKQRPFAESVIAPVPVILTEC
jgi:hypothetical protein